MCRVDPHGRLYHIYVAYGDTDRIGARILQYRNSELETHHSHAALLPTRSQPTAIFSLPHLFIVEWKVANSRDKILDWEMRRLTMLHLHKAAPPNPL